MNEKKAKKLRKLVFGDRSFRGRNEYVAIFHTHKTKNYDLPDGQVLRYVPFTVYHKPGTDHANYHIMKEVLKHEDRL